MLPLSREAAKVSGLTAEIHKFLQGKAKDLAFNIPLRQYPEKLEKRKEGPDIGNWDELVGIMVTGLRPTMAASARRAAIQAKASRKLVEQADVKASAWAEDRAAEMVGMKWSGNQLIPNPDAEWVITETTREEMRVLIQEGIDEGWTASKLADMIEASDQFSEARAEMIARTELSLAHNEASLIGWNESGQVKSKFSILSDDHEGMDVCDTNAEAGEIPIDEEFPSGDMTKPFHPNCSCGVAAVLKDLDTGDESEGDDEGEG